MTNYNIIFSENKDFNRNELESLFLSVNWSSGQYADKLVVAMKNSHSVISAWHNDELIGLVNCLSDGIMTAYFHYLLVHPDFQGKGIGQELIQRILSKYESYARKILIGYDEKVPFYEKIGFKKGKDVTALFVTDLTT